MKKEKRYFIRVKKKVPVLLLYIACVVPSFSFAQQQPQYSQYMFNQLIINPAYAGADEALSLTFVNRSQWSSISGAPVTQTLSAHTLFGNRHVGLGITLVNDRIGVHKNQQAFAGMAYHLQVAPKGFLSMGFQGGVIMRRSDYASLNNGGTPDPKLGTTPYSQSYLNFGAGIYYRSPHVHLGLSAPSLLPETMTVSDTVSIQWRQAQYLLFSRFVIKVSDHIDLEPGFLVKYKQGLPVSVDLNGCVTIKKALTLGVSYRKDESIDFLMRAQLTPQLQVGYAYDLGTGEVSRASRGSHELMLHYNFSFTRKNKTASPR